MSDQKESVREKYENFDIQEIGRLVIVLGRVKDSERLAKKISLILVFSGRGSSNRHLRFDRGNRE